MIEKEKINEKEKEYSLVQVPTEHQLMVQTPEGEVISQSEAVVEILNKLDKIIKQVA